MGFDLDDYQEWTKETAVYPHACTCNAEEVNYLIHGLVGEAGELSNKFKKFLRGDEDKRIVDVTGRAHISLPLRQDLIDEAGDVLWYLARFCSSQGIFLSELAVRNQNKLLGRKEKWYGDSTWHRRRSLNNRRD